MVQVLTTALELIFNYSNAAAGRARMVVTIDHGYFTTQPACGFQNASLALSVYGAICRVCTLLQAVTEEANVTSFLIKITTPESTTTATSLQ